MYLVCWKGRFVNFFMRVCYLGLRFCVGGCIEYIVILVGYDWVGNLILLEEEEERFFVKKILKFMEEIVFLGMLMLWVVGDNENCRIYGVFVYVYVLFELIICFVLIIKIIIVVKEMKNMGLLIRF